MLTHFFSRLRRTPVGRAATTARPRALNFEALEARDVPAIAYALTDGNALLRFDTATPTATTTTAVTGLGAGETLVGIDFRPRTGQLIGSTVPTAGAAPQVVRTYAINPTTGAATLIGATAAPVAGVANVVSGYDFNPTVDRIRFVNEDLANIRLNPNNGALAGADTNIAPNTADLVGVAYDRNTDRQNPNPPLATSILTTLFAIDRATNTLGTIGGVDGTPSPNAGAYLTVGALGVTLDAATDAGFDIIEDFAAAGVANNTGLGRAFAALTVGGVTGLYNIDLTTGAATLIGNVGAGTAEVLGLAVVPEGTLVVGSGLGANGDVRLLDPATGATRVGPITPFDGFRGGVRVAAGDVNGDGVPDAIVTAVEAPNGHVKVFDGVTGQQLNSTIGSFFAFEGFVGSVNVAAGDVDGDGFADVIVVANGANGHVKTFSGRDGSQISSFFAYPGFLGNVTVAAADFDNNGVDEVVTAAAINGHVKVFAASTANGTTPGGLFTPAAGTLPNFVSSFFAFSPYLGDVSVAAGDLTGDGVPDLALLSGAGVRLNARVVDGTNGSLLSSFFVDNFGPGFVGGGRIGVSDFDRDGRYDVVVTPGVGVQATAVALDPLTGALLTGGSFPAFANFQGGATVAGARF